MARLSIRNRPATSLVEVTVTLAVIAVLAAVVAQAMVLSQRERARVAAHQAALELAANVLEAARAQPFEQLDQAWADSQTIPSDLADLLPEGKIVVTVEPGKPEPHTRRVTVEVRWQFEPHLPPQSTRLTGVLSGRVVKKGGQP